MDPVSIFSLTTNVLQLIDLGIRVAKCCANLNAGENSYAALEDQAESLTNCNKTLHDAVVATSDEASLTQSERDLLRVGKKCAAAAEKLQIETQKLTPPATGKHRKRQLFKIALKTSTGNEKLARLEKEFEGYRDDLHTHILVDLR